MTANASSKSIDTFFSRLAHSILEMAIVIKHRRELAPRNLLIEMIACLRISD